MRHVTRALAEHLFVRLGLSAATLTAWSGCETAGVATGGGGAGGGASSAGGAGASGGAGGSGGAAGGAGSGGGAAVGGSGGTGGESLGVGGAAGAGGQAAGGGSPPDPCVSPTPVIVDGHDSGFVTCADGTIHREKVGVCSTTNNAQACIGNEALLDCQLDSDCTAKPNGKCIHQVGGFAPGGDNTSCGCVYACQTDAECDAGQICMCDGVMNSENPWSHCVDTTGCRLSSDCAEGECGLSVWFDGCFWHEALKCRTPEDDCRLDADCPGGISVCEISDDVWSCNSTLCTIGRPFSTGAGARVAGIIARDDWRRRHIDVAAAGTATERAGLIAHWEATAQLEHASVASFNRFSMQLLALGAPAQLVADAQHAALDEVEHARLAYAVVSSLTGQPVGPARLSLAGVTLDVSLEEFARALVDEACVSEAVGAAEAQLLSETVSDDVQRTIYRRIAEDELRHAELGYRTLRWLVEEHPELTETIRDAFASSIREVLRVATPTVVAPELGLWSRGHRLECRWSAVHDMIEPLAEAILGQKARASDQQDAAFAAS